MPFRRIDMASAQASFSLIGSDKAYENSQTGMVFDALALEPMLPVLFADELDKAAGDGSRYPVTGPLYQLWEPGSALDFRDASIPQVALDTRFIVWIAASNDASVIPDPILSRLRVFTIAPPSPEAMRSIARVVLGTIWREAGRRNEPPKLSEPTIDLLITLPIRSMRTAVASAAGRALLERRWEIHADDLPVGCVAKRRIGF